MDRRAGQGWRQSRAGKARPGYTKTFLPVARRAAHRIPVSSRGDRETTGHWMPGSGLMPQLCIVPPDTSCTPSRRRSKAPEVTYPSGSAGIAGTSWHRFSTSCGNNGAPWFLPPSRPATHPIPVILTFPDIQPRYTRMDFAWRWGVLFHREQIEAQPGPTFHTLSIPLLFRHPPQESNVPELLCALPPASSQNRARRHGQPAVAVCHSVSSPAVFRRTVEHVPTWIQEPDTYRRNQGNTAATFCTPHEWQRRFSAYWDAQHSR